MGAELALVFQLQRGVVEHIDGVLFLLGVPVPNYRVEQNLLVEIPIMRRLTVGSNDRRRELNLPDITVADTASLHGLLYISPLARLLEFVAGMTTCIAFRRAVPKITAASAWIFTVLEIGALFFAGWVLVNHTFLGPAIRLLPSTAIIYLSHADLWPGVVPIIFVFAFQKGAISRALSLKPFLLLGEVSYSLYLVHSMAFAVIAKYLGITGLFGFAFGCATSLALAFALWRWIEIPARKTIRKLAPAPTSLHARPARAATTSDGQG